MREYGTWYESNSGTRPRPEEWHISGVGLYLQNVPNEGYQQHPVSPLD